AEGMDEKNGWPNAIEQLGSSRPYQIAVKRFVGDVALFACHELIDQGIVHAAWSRPLRGVEHGGALDESFVGGNVRQMAGAQRIGMIRRPAITGTIHPVDAVAGLD